ncbi:type IV secretory system conjugative DNA transfer family protein [Mycoplasmopsis pullorum]|uniref:type IV secretory system conjugative DNA transfer family protein n=3 Tax=Mycoplasmopsis pullorum TaxID=48003 RepID=UPI0015D64738|nr:type IV secretory system conjugative DNA transfer family protein [Mycoplasmopsis pullorum]
MSSVISWFALWFYYWSTHKKQKEYRKDKEPESIYLWNDKTKQGNLELLRRDFMNNSGANNWVLGYHINKNKINWIVNKMDLHAKLIGTTGSGKSQYVILPSIYYNAALKDEQKPCMLITDPKKELFNTLYNHFKDNDYDIKLINLVDINESELWNPLDIAYEKLNSKPFNELTQLDYEDMNVIINEIVSDLNWPQTKESIWVESGKTIITGILLYLSLTTIDNPLFEKMFIQKTNRSDYVLTTLLKYIQPTEFQNGKWRQDLELMKDADIWWNKTYQMINNLPADAVATLQGALFTPQTIINKFVNDYKLEKIISASTINFQELFSNSQQRPFVIFVCYPDEKDSINSFIPLFFRQFYKFATEYANKQPNLRLHRNLQIYFEEFGSLPIISNFDKNISISRSRGIFFLLVIQSLAQLKKYDSGNKENITISDNTALTYFLATNDYETLENMSKESGRKHVISTSFTQSEKGSSSTQQIDEPVFSITDLKYKEQNEIVIYIPNYRPLLLKSTPFWKGFKNVLNDKRSRSYIPSEQQKILLNITKQKHNDFNQPTQKNHDEIVKMIMLNDYQFKKHLLFEQFSGTQIISNEMLKRFKGHDQNINLEIIDALSEWEKGKNGTK